MTGTKKIRSEVDVPEGADVKIEDGKVTVSGSKGTTTRRMAYPGVKIDFKDGKVSFKSTKQSKVTRAIRGTFAAHVKNMIAGVTSGFEYSLKVVYSHFPITVKQAGDTILIDNFLGEKTPRKSRVHGESSVSIKGDAIVVSGVNVEDVAQTAANLELATKVKGRDRRVFQDGIYLISKGVTAS